MTPPTLTLDEKIQAREDLLLDERERCGQPPEIRPVPPHCRLRQPPGEQRHHPGSHAVLPPAYRILQLLQEQDGDLRSFHSYLKEGVKTVEDPFSLLPSEDTVTIRG